MAASQGDSLAASAPLMRVSITITTMTTMVTSDTEDLIMRYLANIVDSETHLRLFILILNLLHKMNENAWFPAVTKRCSEESDTKPQHVCTSQLSPCLSL